MPPSPYGDGMTLGSITQLYLPPKLWGAMEHRIGPYSSLTGPILPAREIDENNWHRPFMSGVDHCARNLTTGIFEPFYYCMTDTPTVNAMIARFANPDFHGVAVARGCYENVYALTVALLNHEPLRNFIELGERPSDDGRLPERGRREALTKILSEAGSSATIQSMELGALVSNIAGYFLMGHEIGHMALGHLPLFERKHATEGDEDQLVDLAVSRSLERDADLFAAAATVWNIGSPPMLEKWGTIFPDQLVLFRCFFVGAYILFSIMDLGRGGDEIAQQTHPAPMVRITSTAGPLATVMNAWGRFSHEDVWDCCREAVRAVEIATLGIGGGMMDAATAERLTQQGNKATEEHLREMPALMARMDRSMLDHYFWAKSLREWEHRS